MTSLDPAEVFGDRLPVAEHYHTSLAEVTEVKGTTVIRVPRIN